jgi:hypothetical protein
MLAMLAACQARTVELGKVDAAAAIDSALPDASLCRCRLNSCRVPGDCTLTGGVCGPDSYCVGDFGACSTASQCQATATASTCTASATSIAPCP